jgi:hypothetical protein
LITPTKTAQSLSAFAAIVEGSLKAQHVVWIDVDDMQLCEDLHAIFGHVVMQKLCDYF